jgi:hypothetical protein
MRQRMGRIQTFSSIYKKPADQVEVRKVVLVTVLRRHKVDVLRICEAEANENLER